MNEEDMADVTAMKIKSVLILHHPPLILIHYKLPSFSENSQNLNFKAGNYLVLVRVLIMTFNLYSLYSWEYFIAKISKIK